MGTDRQGRVSFCLYPHISCAVGSGSPFPASVAISIHGHRQSGCKAAPDGSRPLYRGSVVARQRRRRIPHGPGGAVCRSFHCAAGGVRHRGPPAAPRKWCSTTESEVVRLTLAGLPRPEPTHGAAVQAPAPLDDAVEAILATARLPRERGPRGMESPERADRRGLVDIQAKNTHPGGKA